MILLGEKIMNELLIQAKSALQNRKYLSAMKKYSTLVSTDPNNAEVQQGLAECLYKLKKYQQALLVAQKCIDIRPNLERPYQIRSYIYAHMGQYKSSEGEIKKAIQINQKSAESLAFLAGLLLFQHKVQDSMALLKQSIKIDPNLWLARYNLGLVLNEQNRFVEAYEEFKLAYKANPSFRTGFAVFDLFLLNKRSLFLSLVTTIFILSYLLSIKWPISILLICFYLTGFGYIAYRRWIQGILLVLMSTGILVLLLIVPI